MFRMDVSTAVCLYILSTLLAIFAGWIFFEKKVIFPKFIREKADVWECAICAYIYVDSRHHEISQCPQCKSYNKRSPEERLL
jgi:Zn finger protein HypA/HybF involved in hydrogenase expression